jgi:hypothetical protein
MWGSQVVIREKGPCLMKINITSTDKEYIRLAGYISNNFNSIYLEIHGASYGHIMLSDLVPELKSHKVGNSDDVAGYIKFEVNSRSLFCSKSTDSVTLLNSDLGPSEKEFCYQMLKKSMSKLLDIIATDPWVKVRGGVSYWDGDSILCKKLDTYQYVSMGAVTFSNYTIFGKENYIFDDGTPVPPNCNMFKLEELEDEHDD